MLASTTHTQPHAAHKYAKLRLHSDDKDHQMDDVWDIFKPHFVFYPTLLLLRAGNFVSFKQIF